MIDTRSPTCRERLREEGKPYPRSSCQACGWRAMGGAISPEICRKHGYHLPGDGRPAGWTEARALAFCATLHGPSDAQEFARMFTHGEWRKVMQEFPDFIEWIAKQ